MFHHLRRSLAWGCSLGVGVGIAEALYLYSTAVETPLGGFRVVTSAVLLYLIIALVWSLPTGLVLGLVHRLRGKPDPGEGLYGALYLALGVVLVATYRVNVEFLGGFLDLSSLLVDAALLAVSWPLLTLLLRRPFRALSRSFGPAWPKLGPVYWMAVLLAAGLPQFGDDPRVGAAPPTAEAPASAPNVLFLLVDTLRADHLGCYGYPRGTSPRIDALASRGILFEDCVSQAPHTKQSTASILTSLYPPTHKMDTLWASLSPKAQILPEVFHDGGWRTCLMSANSFLSPTFGFGRGVERFEGTLVNPAMQLLGSAVVNRFRRLAVQEFHTWAAPWNLLRDLNSWSFLGPEGNPYQHGMPAADLRDQFLGWQAGLEGGAPWFAYLQFMEPHAPYDPAPEHRLFDNPEYGSTEGVWFPGSTELTFLPFQRGAEATAEERQAMINNYDACIHEVDAAVGQILDELERRGELENTLVVLTSDHGEEFYEHGGWGHGQSLHAELLGVPLILAGPRVPRGVRVPGQVRSVDIMPTVLQASGLEPPAGCSGEVLDLRAEAAAREAYSEVQWGGHWAVAWRDADGTLIHANFRGEDSRQLYAEADRRETTDLAPGDPAAVRTLSGRMGGRRAEYSARALQAIETFVDDSFKDNAAGLGYVDGDPDQDDE